MLFLLLCCSWLLCRGRLCFLSQEMVLGRVYLPADVDCCVGVLYNSCHGKCDSDKKKNTCMLFLIVISELSL